MTVQSFSLSRLFHRASMIQSLRLISIVGSFLVGFWIPLRWIGYQPTMSLEIFFDLLISTISLINIYLYFHEREISWRDWRSWLSASLWIDVVCFLPFSLWAFASHQPTWQWVLALNLLTIRHIGRIRKFLDGFAALQPITYRLAPLLIVLPLLIHLVACGWIALGSGTAGIDEDAILTYVKAMYWSFTTLTTVGYGDIAAKTIPQMIYTCAIQVLGVGVFGFILSNVASLLARSDAAREHHMDNLDKIETFMDLHHTPAHLRAKIRTYYHYMWTHKKGYKDGNLLEGLPAKIQSELFLHINRAIIEKVPFLRGADPDLLEDLMSELQARVYIPGEKIFKIDDHGDALYFIQSGHVQILSREGKELATLSDGSFFGEMALISDKPRSATALADSFCDIYVLEKKAFDRVTSFYPHFREHVESVMHQRRSA